MPRAPEWHRKFMGIEAKSFAGRFFPKGNCAARERSVTFPMLLAFFFVGVQTMNASNVERLLLAALLAAGAFCILSALFVAWPLISP